MKEVLEFLETGILYNEDINWYKFLGFCDFHRLSGYFADKMPNSTPPQVKRHLDIQKRHQSYRQEFLSSAASEIENRLQKENLPHAFLKGSALAGTLYKTGERGSNDIDVLLSPKDVGKAGKVLEELGYVQGLYRDGGIKSFSRQEIISRRMNRGETAPYLKLTGDDMMPFVEIDVNFSLDWLPASDTSAVEEFLCNTERLPNGLTTLDTEYALIFLCMHLYKEATVLSMVKRYKDIELYKYLDIFKMLKIADIKRFWVLADKLSLKNQCEYVIYLSNELFPSLNFWLKKPENIDTVIDPENSDKKYQWDLSFIDRVEDTGRMKFLSENLDNGESPWMNYLKNKMMGRM